MTACDFTVELFCRVDDAFFDTKKHILSHLHPSEVVTLGLLQSLRGEGNRAFYLWVTKELKNLFPRLPERTRLFRLMQQYASLTRRFLAQPSFFGVCDSYGIELIHPLREGRSERQIGGKGKSNHRWIVGAKLAVICNDQGQIMHWGCGSGRLHDTVFQCLIEDFQDQMVILSDKGFKAKAGNPSNLKVCERGRWNERMLIETLFFLFTYVLHLKKLSQRLWPTLRARLAYTMAAFNICTKWNGKVKLQLAPFAL
jgi:hypothetical protein